MPPRRLKSMECHADLSEAGTRKFPFRVGDEVEMKSFQNGYRGAWFRVKIKKMRKDKRNKILCSMEYIDYSDEKEEEIYAFGKDTATNELSLMIRPTPPTSVKESNFDKFVDTRMYVVYRDEWERGDLVDWWYHDCWWAAKVTRAVGNSKFQIACPAPPCGEGGEYLAHSRDLRPSLRWSQKTLSWSAPPSKEIGKQPCARIVRLMNTKEAEALSAPIRRRGPLSQRKGRPKMPRRFPLPRKEVALAGEERGPCRMQRMMHLSDIRSGSPFSNREILSSAYGSTVSKLAQNRERSRKPGSREEEVKKRKKPLSLKVIYPREDPAHEKDSASVAGEPRIDPKTSYETLQTDIDMGAHEEEGNCEANEISPRIGTRGENSPSDVDSDTLADVKEQDAQGEDAHGDTEAQVANGVRVPRWCRTVNALPCARATVSRGNDPQMSDRKAYDNGEKNRGIKQKRSVTYIPCKSAATGDSLLSNGHYDNFKRRRLDQIKRLSDLVQVRDPNSEAEAETHAIPICTSITERSGTRNELTRIRSTRRRKQKKFGGTSTRKSMLLNCGDRIMVQRMGDLFPVDQMSVPPMDGEKDVLTHQVAEEQEQRPTPRDQNEQVQPDLFGCSFILNPERGDGLVEGIKEHLNVNDAPKASAEESKESKILKVLSAYQEAFTDSHGLDMSNAYSGNDVDTYQASLTGEETCSERQVELPSVGAYEEHFMKDIWAPGQTSHLNQETPPLKTKQSKPWDLLIPKSQDKQQNTFRVTPPRKGFQAVEPRNKFFDREAKESATGFHDDDLTHDLANRREPSSLDRITHGRSQESPPGRWGNLSINSGEVLKGVACNHRTASGVQEVSGPSLHFSSTAYVCPEKNDENLRLSGGFWGLKLLKTSKMELLGRRKWNGDPIRMRKVCLSRKIIKLARRRKLFDFTSPN